MKKIIFAVFICVTVSFVASCGGSKVPTGFSIDISANDIIRFDDTLFTVKAGVPVTVTFRNIGTLPAAAVSHNFVILNPGADVDAFGLAGSEDSSVDHIPAFKNDEVIARTKMLGPGRSDKITFTLPVPGRYPFLCTFPGHFMSQHGTIIAE